MSATTSRLPHLRLLRLVRRALDAVEEALRPDEADADDRPSPADEDGADGGTTREILLPTATGEPPARRAERQAHDYLARRRRKLAAQLDHEPAGEAPVRGGR